MNNSAIVAANVLSKREAPWIGIGVKGEWHDYRDALIASQLDFRVGQEKVYWNRPVVPINQIIGYPNTVVTQQPEELDLLVNVRDTDNRALGVVTRQYGVVQNEDAFSLLEPFTKAGGIITNAGMTEQGLCFMVLRMHQVEFLGDTFDFDVMCTNSFNTAFPLALMMVPIRIYCQNMYRKLVGGGSDMLMHLRHGNQIDRRIEAANRAIGNIQTYIDNFGRCLQTADGTDMDKQKLMILISMLFPYPKPGGPREQASKEKVDALRKEFYERYYLADDNSKFHGTALGFLNAYYDYLSHRTPTKCMPGSWNDRRLSGLVSGNDVNANVIKEAMR